MSDLKNRICEFSGKYNYFNPGITISPGTTFSRGDFGTMVGKIQEVLNSDNAVIRLDITLDWAEQRGRRGKGVLTMSAMNRLDGTWGLLDSNNNGGTWFFQKR